MTTPVEKRNASKFCEFHGEVGHTTDECMHLKRQIEEMLKAGKLLHLIKELKQNNRKNQAKVAKKGEATGKDKPLAILMGKKTERKGPWLLKLRKEDTLSTACDEEHSTSAWMNFMVVRLHSPYNKIIGRIGVRRIKAIPSTAHGMLKFPVTGGTVTLQSSRIIPLECAMISGPRTQQPVVDKVTEEKIQVAIHPEYPKQTIAIGSTLTEEGRKKLCGLLRQNLDIFAWKPADMTRVPRHIAEHRLNVRKGCFPVRQKKRGQAPERNKAICEDVEKLVNTGIMKEVHYHSWLSNLVMVKKHDNSWRMCVDFKDLNKACPKDGYTLPKIDWKVESLCGYPFKCFLDAAAKEAISVVLMTERDGKQISIYFVSRALRGDLDRNLRPMEKLVLNLVRKVTTLLKWSFELEEHDIQYRPRTSVKGQILADFIVERPEDNLEDTLMEGAEELPDPWTLFTDGSSCADGSGAGLILTNPEGMEFTYALRFRFDATNNEAEYEALIAGLKIAEQMGVENLQANVDSRLVANQVNGTYVAKETDMIRYLEKVKTLTSSFKAFSIKQVPRNENKKADALSKIASTSFAHLSKQVLVEELKEKSISAAEVLAVVEEEGDTWMTPIFKYLSDGTLPAEGKKARAVKRKSWRFSIINGILYKKSFLGPWLRCVGPLQANYVLREIHEGSCSMHAGTRSVVAKALRIGYYWPTMHEDARNLRKTNGSSKERRSLGEWIKARLDERIKNWMEELPHPSSPAENRHAHTNDSGGSGSKYIRMKLWKLTRTLERQSENKNNTNNEASYAEDTGKLGPKWEGPYEVTEALGNGAYKLKDRDRNQLPWTWNISNLKKCYVHKM
ncbi:reverse transcriptase domain-containing protein [Tanacetum coccineum]